MIKCTGICSKCGRCKNAAAISGANDRKTRMLVYPDDFLADRDQGLAAGFDIGTTTLVGMLWDLETGQQIAASAETNPQNEYGLDVISRISSCGRNNQGLELLRGKLTGALNGILRDLCAKASRSSGEIRRLAVCGNTTMSHIFAGYPVDGLAMAPFEPAYHGALEMKGAETGLDIDDECKVVVLPNIAGHVGGDITAGILSSRLLDMKGLTLFIDVGTNGEIAVSDGQRCLVCSTAAGPAFEGAAIEHGMRAADGAIEKVSIEDGCVILKTIGNTEPQGICGSGLIDALAQMLDAGLVDKSGRLAAAGDADTKSFDARLCERLLEIESKREFVLAEDAEGARISVTQNDIRQVQMAKGAVKAGIDIILGRLGKTSDNLDRVILAGAFGNYIDKRSAVRIGLLPDVDPENIISAGNTAGAGVMMSAASIRECLIAERIPDMVEHVELADEADFQMKYIMSMGF